MAESLTIKGVYSNLSIIGDFIERFAVQAGLDDRSVYALQMSVDEACSNIIEHAYGGEGKGEIHLKMELLEDRIRVIIQDQGKPFDPDSVPPPDINAPVEDRPEGGLGLFLMRQLMDEVVFSFGGGDKANINTLILVKRTS